MTPYAPASEPGRDPRSGDAEVVDICRDLIRIDTSNYGPEPGPGERVAAEHVAALLDEVGIALRAVRVRAGADVAGGRTGSPTASTASLSPLLIHGHLDVVPADAADWSVPPFAGEVADDCVWGRGAVDMKDFDAMVLSVVRARARAGDRAAAADPAGLHRRRGGRRRPRARTGWWRTVPTCSRAAPRRSVRSAASP